MDYAVTLDVFQGPLDLLLKLIKDNQVDIYDIPIALITEQYLALMQEMIDIDLEVMADFMVMAATLISIKSRMLLPKIKSVEADEEENEDPRQELVRQLIEYRQFKELAHLLDERMQGMGARVYYRDDPSVDPELELRVSVNQLFRAFQNIWNERTDAETMVEIPRGDINIFEKIDEIEEYFRLKPRRTVTIQEMFSRASNRREAVVLFLALLELIKLGRVRAYQASPFSTIEIKSVWSRRDVV